MSSIFTTKSISAFFAAIIVTLCLLGFWWSFEPDVFDVDEQANQQAQANNQTVVTGYTTTTALIIVLEKMLDKPGGYIYNDMMPPGILMDNIPSWEFGVIEMSRDLALAIRRDFGRSQSQSIDSDELADAQTSLNLDNNRWLLPSTEGEYTKAINHLYTYRNALGNSRAGNNQFYARADNLRDYLKQVEKRLGSLSQNLSASVGTEVINTNLAGDPSATYSSPEDAALVNKTGWFQLDNNFYEARGASWALLHFLKALETDFAEVLRKKNATVSLQQIIRELEATQGTVFSPVILNGGGFGMLANHSLVMANYISRANAAIIELSELLNQG
ncbi:hypothetical protein GPUN_2140 [Glaciecola punicea ACAM 611]|jgi:hypothetical protein|uniref:DUF2333 domain-containing protein n=1 Tax=Glaciecola punicea ACAM 611 TaxID=1121923 RepID=H5TD78_9ALTE|nr:DUF2333 family protein [Glaciecola punicea]GAB56255.1 hypothetical protein GPUN_2140 [Glaciecola punicea ACAM 611]